MNKVVCCAVITACLAGAVGPVLAQDDNVPPQITNTTWFILRNLDGKLDTFEDGTLFGYDPFGFQAFEPTVDLAREFDLLIVDIDIMDPDFLDDDGEEVFVAFNAHFTPLAGYPTPIGPPVTVSVEELVGPFTSAGPTTITVRWPIMITPSFIGKNQARLRGLIDWDVRYRIVLAVSNEQDPESWTPGLDGNPLLCGFFVASEDDITHVFCDLLHIVENPAAAPPNPQAIADAGPDMIVETGQTVELDASRTFDGFNIGFNVTSENVFEKDNITFTWEWITGPERVDPIYRDLENRPQVAEVTLNKIGTYVYRVTADDNVNGLPTTDTMSIDVVSLIPENRPPVARIVGPTGAIVVGGVILLDGTSSSDPDGDPLSFRWRQIDELGGNLSEAEVLDLFQPLGGVESPISTWQATQAGTFFFRLLVDDGSLIDSTTTSLTVIEPGSAVAVVGGDGATGKGRDGDSGGAEGQSDEAVTAPSSVPACGGGLLPLAMLPFALWMGRGRIR